MTALHDLGQRLQTIGDARRGLVVGNQDGRDLRLFAQKVVEVLRIGGFAPGRRVADHLGAKGLGQIGEAVTESANRDREHPLARRDKVDHRAFEAAGPAGRKNQDVILGLEGPLQARLELGQERFELGTTVVDHGGGHRAVDAVRDRRRTGNTQLWSLCHGFYSLPFDRRRR